MAKLFPALPMKLLMNFAQLFVCHVRVHLRALHFFRVFVELRSNIRLIGKTGVRGFCFKPQ